MTGHFFKLGNTFLWSLRFLLFVRQSLKNLRRLEDQHAVSNGNHTRRYAEKGDAKWRFPRKYAFGDAKACIIRAATGHFLMGDLN